MPTPGSRRMSPRLSILVPTWNAATTVERALESVLVERAIPLEVVVVDDGSTDGTADLVAAIAARDPRVVLAPAAGQRRRLERPQPRSGGRPRRVARIPRCRRSAAPGRARRPDATDRRSGGPRGGRPAHPEQRRAALDLEGLRQPGRPHPRPEVDRDAPAAHVLRVDPRQGLPSLAHPRPPSSRDASSATSHGRSVRCCARATGSRSSARPSTNGPTRIPITGSRPSRRRPRRRPAGPPTWRRWPRPSFGRSPTRSMPRSRTRRSGPSIKRAYFERLVRSDLSGPVKKALDRRDPATARLFEAIATFLAAVPAEIVATCEPLVELVL